MNWLLPSFLLIALGLFWFESLRVRETVLAACRRACRQLDVQLLDETVALERLRLSRWRIERVYRFEYSSDGSERQRGHVQVLGRWVRSIQLESEQGLTIL